MKKIVTLVLLVVAANCFFGQTPFASASLRNSVFLYNPSESSDSISMLALNARTQWIGVGQATPNQGALYFRKLFGKGKIGLAAQMNHLQFGVFKRSSFMVDGSYNLKTNYGQFALGLRLGAELWSYNLADVYVHDASDPQFSTNISNEISANRGLGFSYKWKFIKVGFSLPRLMENDIADVDGTTTVITRLSKKSSLLSYINFSKTIKEQFQLDFMAGYIGSEIDKAQPWFDAKVGYRNMLELGAQYRYSNSFSAYLTSTIKSNYKLIFAFEMPVNSNIPGKTAEIGLQWLLSSNKTKTAENE
jgi:type IX secretion system PorP/SprF family membrane protein